LISFLNNYGFEEELKCFEKNINIKNIKYFQKDSEEFYKKEIKLLEKINELEKELLKKENNIFLNNSQENNSIINHIYNVQPNNSNLNIINSNQNKKHKRVNSHLSNENSIKSKDFQNNNQKINNFLYKNKRINNINNNNNNNSNINFYYNLEREQSNQTHKSVDEKVEDSSNYNIFDKKNENYIIQFGKNKKDKFTSKCLCKKCKNYFIKNEKSNQINYGCYFNFNDINDNLCPNCNKKKNYNKNK
jgi:hypothetical protein